MGRRPHALIQEFFDRGPKLDDNSNRYQHTCKRCGEYFPKGRIDGLTTHLLRRCSNLTQPDRTWVFQQLQLETDKPPRSAKRSHAETLHEMSAPTIDQYQSELPPPTAQQQSALETLAEVSGRHSSRAGASNGSDEQHAATTVAEAIAEQALLAQLQGHIETNNNSTTTSTSFGHSASSPPTHQSSKFHIQPSGDLVSTSAAPLVQTASAASQHMEQNQASEPFMEHLHGVMQGNEYQSFNIPIDMGFRMGELGPGPDMSWIQPTVPNAMPSFGSLTMPQHDPMSGFGILSNSAKQKPRGRFDDVRRKEVSKMRKQGSCLRCRMLKKPCSEDTPCKTCATVESARIWKGKCLRTRLSDEMTLWSMKASHARAKAKLATTAGLEGRETTARVAVSFVDGPSHIDFPARLVVNSDPACISTSDLEDGANTQALVWRLVEEDMAEDKIGAYARERIGRLIATQSAPMKDILQKTQRFSAAEPSTHADKDEDCGREEATNPSSGSPRDGLSKNVLELWALTEILTSRDATKLAIKVSNDTPIEDNAGSSPETIQPGSLSHGLIHAQLAADMEARCSTLSKTILNELERRLLLRQQTSRLATLLSALVLLSCVERMTGYYRSFDKDLSQADEHVVHRAPSSSSDGRDARKSQDNTTGLWPLEIAPLAIWPQGEHFADLLISLLRMRALPPKTRITPEGTLVSMREFSMSAQPAKKPDDEQKEAAADWLDLLNLTAEPLKEKRDAEIPGPEDGLEAWSLRYVARVLLPERGR